MFLISGGRYSKSLSPKYKARRVSRRITTVSYCSSIKNSEFLPSLKKFPGKTFSFKLLYDKSNTSSIGKAPKPLKVVQILASQAISKTNSRVTHRGSELRRLIEQLRILNFGIDESDSGSSSRWLLDKFRISKLIKFAIPGGNTKNRQKLFSNFSMEASDSPDILLCDRVRRVTNNMLTARKKGARTLDHYSKITKLYKQMGGQIFFYFHNWACQCRSRHLQMVGISSNECRLRSTRSISRFCSSRASSRIFLTLDILLETGKH